ncbi:MAG: LamG-like jellyroll fold domain-containing protein [Elusimicrobiota bacterium]
MKSALLLSILLGLPVPAAFAALDDSEPNLSAHEVTDCEGNWVSGAVNTTTGTASVRMEVKDDVGSVKSGLRIGKTTHDGGATSRTGTVLLLHLNDVGVPDSSPAGNAVENNGVSVPNDGPPPVGDFFKSGNFEANNGDYLKIPAAQPMNSTYMQQMTIQMWIKPTAVTSMPLFEWNNGLVAGQTNGVNVWMGATTNNGDLYANLIDTGGVAHVLTSGPGFIQSGVWQLVTFTYDGQAAQFWKNDVFVSSKDFGSMVPLQTRDDAYVGRRPTSVVPAGAFNGDIDEVRVLNTKLDYRNIPLAVANDYHAGIFRHGRTEASLQTTYLDFGHYTTAVGPPPQGYLGSATATVTGLNFPDGVPMVVSFSFQDRAGNTNWWKGNVTSIIDVPTTPGSPAATSPSTTQLDWSWTKPSRICLLSGGSGRYKILDNDNNVLYDNIGALSFSEAGRTANTLYTRKFRGYDDYGLGDISSPVSAYTRAADLDPNSIGSSAISTGSIVVSWGANGNPDGTRYELTLWSNASYTAVLSTPIPIESNFTTRSTALTGLTPSTTYYIRIRAKNGRDGDGGLGTLFTSYISTAIPTLALGPDAPVGNPLGVSSITWTWQAVATAQSYTLQDEAGGPLIENTPLRTFTQQSLAVNARYSAKVRANGASGPSLFSAVTYNYTNANPPLSVAVVDVTTASLTATWSAGDGNPAGTSYEIYIATDSGFGGSVASDNTTARQMTFTNLLPGGTYYIRVRAVSSNSNRTEYAFPTPAGVVTPSMGPSSSAQTPPTPYSPPSGTVLLWHFDESSGTSVADASNQGHTGTLGCMETSCSSPTFVTSMAGLGNAARLLTGRPICRVTDAGSFAGTGSVTVDALVKLEDINQLPGAGIVVKGNGGQESYALDIASVASVSDLHWRFFVNNAGLTARYAAVSTQPVRAGRWTHLTGVYDASRSSVTLYVDGVFTSSKAAAASRYNDAHELSAGNRQTLSSAYDKPLRGALDEVRVLNTPLSPAQVAASHVSYSASTMTLPAPNDGVRLVIPPDAFGAQAVILVSSNPVSNPISANPLVVANGLASPPTTGHIYIPGSVIEVVVNKGGFIFEDTLGSTVTLSVTYPDADGNTLVDGVSPPIPAANLRLWTLNMTGALQWVELSSCAVDLADRRVSAVTEHFSVFALFAPTGIRPDVNEVYVYPVPWKPGSGDKFDSATWLGRSGLAFGNLSTDGHIRVFTLSGELVTDLQYGPTDQGTLVWNGKNTAGRNVASGVYFAYVKATDGSTQVLKFAIER